MFEHRAEVTVVDKLKTVNWSNRLGRTGIFVARIDGFPDEGEFVLRVRVRAEMPDGSPFPRMHVALGYRADTQTPSRTVAEVDVVDTDGHTFEFRGRIEEFPIQSRTQSKYPGMLVWVRNSYSDGRPAPAGEKVAQVVDGKPIERLVWPLDPDFPAIVVEEFSFRAPVYRTWPPEHHTRIVAEHPAFESDEPRVVRDVLHRFVRRAYRRPSHEADLEPLLRFYSEVRSAAGSFEQALRETLAMVLVSPEFLYRIEASGKAGRRLTDHELASRLSYFLWGTMPDDRLMGLADRGRLRKERTLRAETERMLADRRSGVLVEQFSSQWLDLDGIERVAVNPNYYPDFDPSLKADMRRETQQYFAMLLRENLSALNFLRSDFTVLNQRLAGHYGIRGPRGSEFERVPLAGTGRRGRSPLAREHPPFELDRGGLAPRGEGRVDSAGPAGRPAGVSACFRAQSRRDRPLAGLASAQEAARAAPGQRGMRPLPSGNRSVGYRAGGVRRSRTPSKDRLAAFR